MRTKLSATMGGRIEVLAVKEGDKVKKGQLLMKLWNDDQQAQSALALTQVETARRRTTEACTVASNAEREAESAERPCSSKVLFPARAMNRPGPTPRPGAPAVTPPRPM